MTQHKQHGGDFSLDEDTRRAMVSLVWSQATGDANPTTMSQHDPEGWHLTSSLLGDDEKALGVFRTFHAYVDSRVDLDIRHVRFVEFQRYSHMAYKSRIKGRQRDEITQNTCYRRDGVHVGINSRWITFDR